MDDQLQHLRVEYAGRGLTAADAGDDPMALFTAWFRDAANNDAVVEPNAMTLATVAVDGTPSARMVLLKGIDARHAAFRWYTNHASRKAREARAAGTAAACWWWPGTPGRQVRAVGTVHEVARADAAAYFATRPPAAQIGAIASRQSRAAASRRDIDVRAAAVRDAGELELPIEWGGLELHATELEFWQGRPGRLHDRITFLLVDEQGVICSRAAAAACGGDTLAHATGTLVTDPHARRWLRLRLEP